MLLPSLARGACLPAAIFRRSATTGRPVYSADCTWSTGSRSFSLSPKSRSSIGETPRHGGLDAFQAGQVPSTMTPTRAAFRTAARLLSRRTYSQHPSKTSPSPSHSSSLDVSSVGVSQSQLARLRRLIRQQSASFRLSPQYQAAARRFPRSITIPLFVLLFLLSSTAAYELIPSARHLAQAVFRCGRLMYAVVSSLTRESILFPIG